MNRKISSGVSTTLALIAILSCSDNSVTGTSGINSDDLNADAARIATVSVSFGSNSISVGDTTTATAVLKDYQGRPLDRIVTWSSSDSTVAKVSPAGLVTGIAPGSAVITAARGYKTGSATISVTTAPSSTSATSPGTVGDLKVAGTDSTGVTLSFTQVDDGTGQPAEYDVRYEVPPISWGAATSTSSGTCRTPVSGTAIGGALTCKVLGLSPGTNYSFQLVAFRGTMNSNAVYGSLSNTVSAATTASGSPPPTVAVASVSVSPISPALQVGGTIQLAATTRDASNNVLIGRTITWASSNIGVASVSSSGFVTAIAVGTAQITATSEGKTASATVTVSAVPPPPPPPPPPGTGHEPSGMTAFTDESFSILPSSNCSGYYTYSLLPDATAPYSPPSVFQVLYPAGYHGGDSPGLTECPIPGNRQLYMSMYVKFSSNFQGHLTHVNKIIHFWIGGTNKLFLLGDASGSQPLLTSIGIQGVASSPYGTSAQVQPNLVPNAQFVRGQWHHLEMVAGANSSGAADGTVDLWLDGVHVASLSGIQWTTGAPSFSDAKLDPTWGGLGDTVISNMTLSVDHLYMSGKN